MSVLVSDGAQASGQVFRPHLGQNITLTCQVSNNATIVAAWWARRDLKSEYVFYYRDGQSDTDIQHPSFQSRVVLAEGELKDGNLSVVLMNVSSSDYGEYTCGFKEHKEGTVVKNEFTCNITLTKPGAGGGNFPRGHVGLGVAAVLLVAAVVFVAVQIYRRPVIKKPELSADDESEDDELIRNVSDTSLPV